MEEKAAGGREANEEMSRSELGDVGGDAGRLKDREVKVSREEKEEEDQSRVEKTSPSR